MEILTVSEVIGTGRGVVGQVGLEEHLHPALTRIIIIIIIIIIVVVTGVIIRSVIIIITIIDIIIKPHGFPL